MNVAEDECPGLAISPLNRASGGNGFKMRPKHPSGMLVGRECCPSSGRPHPWTLGPSDPSPGALDESWGRSWETRPWPVGWESQVKLIKTEWLCRQGLKRGSCRPGASFFLFQDVLGFWQLGLEGSIHGIFQTRVLEWSAIAFSILCLRPGSFFKSYKFSSISLSPGLISTISPDIISRLEESGAVHPLTKRVDCSWSHILAPAGLLFQWQDVAWRKHSVPRSLDQGSRLVRPEATHKRQAYCPPFTCSKHTWLSV